MMYGMMMIVELIFQIYFERTFIVIFKSQDFIDFILEKKIILFLSFRIKIIFFSVFFAKSLLYVHFSVILFVLLLIIFIYNNIIKLSFLLAVLIYIYIILILFFLFVSSSIFS